MIKRYESGWPAADVRALVGRYSAGLREVDAVRYMMHTNEFKRRDPDGFALALQGREAWSIATRGGIVYDILPGADALRVIIDRPHGYKKETHYFIKE